MITLVREAVERGVTFFDTQQSTEKLYARRHERWAKVQTRGTLLTLLTLPR